MPLLLTKSPVQDVQADMIIYIRQKEQGRSRPQFFGTGGFLYIENHALDAWFSRAYGNE